MRGSRIFSDRYTERCIKILPLGDVAASPLELVCLPREESKNSANGTSLEDALRQRQTCREAGTQSYGPLYRGRQATEQSGSRMDNGKRCNQADVEVLVLEAMGTLDERLDVLETKVDIFDRRLSEAEVSL